MGFLNAIVDPAADHRSIFELLLAREGEKNELRIKRIATQSHFEIIVQRT